MDRKMVGRIVVVQPGGQRWCRVCPEVQLRGKEAARRGRVTVVRPGDIWTKLDARDACNKKEDRAERFSVRV